jgi:uncharacterized membrane protein YfcA
MALGHSAHRVRATAMVYFMLTGCVAMVPMAARGTVTGDTLAWSAASSLPVLFGGSWLGSLAFRYPKPRHHRLTALITLSTLAVILIGRTIWS